MSEKDGIQPDVLARALGIDPSVLSYIASQNTASNFSTLPIGISGATAGNVFNPETMLLTGAFSPTQFTAAIDSKYNQMLADYQARVDRAISRPYDATLGSIGLDETFYNPNTEIGQLMQDAVDAIAAGEQTADGALDVINNLISSGQVPAEVADNIGRIGDDLKTFEEKDLPRYRDAVKKYEYDAAQAMANLGVPKPTRQDAKLEYYTSIGLPQLALLPDPTDQYDLPIEEFTNKATMERLRGQSAKAMDVLGQSVDISPMSQRWQGRANMDVARSAAEKAKQDYLLNNTPKDTRDFLQKGLDFAGGSPIIGGLFGGNRRNEKLNEVNRAAQAVYERTYQNKLNELQSNIPNIASYGRDAERAARTERFVQKALARELELAKPKQEKAQAALLAAGITPWAQAMNQMLLNAQAMSTKLK